MSWKQFGGTDNISRHILAQSNISGKSILEIEQNIVRIGNTRLGENQQNAIWFKGLGHSDISLSDYSDNISNSIIEERYYNTTTGDSELFLFKAKDVNPNVPNPYTDSSFNLNNKRGERIRIMAPTIAFDTYNTNINYDNNSSNEDYKNENTKVIINQNGFVGINTITPGQFLDLQGKLNIQSISGEINIYISNSSNPDPSDLGTNNIGIGAYVFSDSQFNSSNNVALGHSSLIKLANGHSNIAIGNLNLSNATNSNHNISLGLSSLNKLTSGDNNVSIGNDSLKNIITGSNNLSIGSSSNSSSTGSSNNITIGNFSGQNIVGDFNSLLGLNSGLHLQGAYNSGFGNHSLERCRGDYNIAFGHQCLKNNITVLSNAKYDKNTFVASYSSNSGHLLLGDFNTGVGYETQFSCSGNRNVSLGALSLYNNSGSNNTAIGYQSNVSNSGFSNISIGINTLNHTFNNEVVSNVGMLNTVVGSYSGIKLQGDYNTTLGSYSDIASGCNKSTAIGCYAHADISNAFVLGDSSDNLLLYGFGTSSPEYTVDVRKPLQNVSLHLKCGRTNHSEILLTRESLDSVVDDVASTFFMRYNSRYDTQFTNTFSNGLDISNNFEEKTYLGFTKDNKYIPVVTYSNLGRIGFLNPEPEFSFDVSAESRFKKSVKFDDLLFIGNASTTSSFYDVTGITKTYFKDKTLFVDGFTAGDGVNSCNINFSNSSNINYNSKPDFKKGITLYGADDYINNSNKYSLDLYHTNRNQVGKTDARIDGHLLIGKDIPENLRTFVLDVAGDVRFDSSCNLNSVNISNTANFEGIVNINDGITQIKDICSFDISNSNCEFILGSSLNILGDFSVSNFNAPYVKSSRYTSSNDNSFNSVINIYDTPMNNSGVLDSSGFFGYSFGDINNNYDQLVQIRSKDIGSNPPNNLTRFTDGKSKNQLLITSENDTNNSQLLLGSFCDNVDANNKSFIMSTDSLYIGKSNPNDINIYDTSANIIIDTSGIVTITGNNLLNHNSNILDVSGNVKMNNINCLQNISSNSASVTGDISCGNFIYAKKLIVDDIVDLSSVSISTDLNINDISANTMKLNDRLDISNMLAIEVSSNTITFNDTNIDISSTSNTFHFNVYRPMNIINNALNVSGGTLNITNGNINIDGSIIADNFEINSNITAIYANVDDIDVSSIDINSATIINSDIAHLDVSNITIKTSGILDSSAGLSRFGDSSLNGTFDVNGTINSNIINTTSSNVTGILNVSTDVSSTHATLQDLSVNNTLDVTGNVNCDTLNGKGIVPVGGIILYNGLSIDIPNNWIICDGSGGITPDLSSQTIFEPSKNVTYYVRENIPNNVAPYYLFSDTSGGTPINSASNPLRIITSNNYTFICSSNIGVIGSNGIGSGGFNVGDGFRVNNSGINVNSNGSGDFTSTGGLISYQAIKNEGESLSFTLNHLYNLPWFYFNSETIVGVNNKIVPFTISDDYSIVYIKRII